MDVPDVADLVEDSIRLLDEASLTDAQFWGAVGGLYAFQLTYESRPTYFRLMDLLERRGYFLTVDLEDHPDYDADPEAFEELGRGTVSPVLRNPGEEWSEEDNPVVGYAAGGDLYVERGSELWTRLVDEEILTGEEANAPEETSLYEAVAEVVEGAERDEDHDLVLRWYAALGFHFGFDAGDEEAEEQLLDELQSNPAIQRIRRVVGDIEGLEMKLAHPERGVEIPRPAVREAHSVLEWWYDLL